MKARVIQPEGFPPPRGYANGMLANNTLHVAGQIGWDGNAEIISDEFPEQFAKALDNVLAVVTAAGGEGTDIADMTIFVTDIQAYIKNASALREVWAARLGSHYPAMALIGISELVHPRALVEIQATAHLGGDAPNNPA